MKDMLQRIKGLLIDLDGTIYVGNQLIPGAKEFVHKLEELSIPHLFVTNITSKPRREVLEQIKEKGLDIKADQVFTAPFSAVSYLNAKGYKRCYFLIPESLYEDFANFSATDLDVDAVIVGDMGGAITFYHLNTAFQLLMGGAELITMSRSRYFMSQDGLKLDAGSYVALLEHASMKEAVVCGKPSAEFFNMALKQLGCFADEVAMIGDDIEGDVGGAQSCGIHGVLVQTGKYKKNILEKSGVLPDYIIPSVESLIDLL